VKSCAVSDFASEEVNDVMPDPDSVGPPPQPENEMENAVATAKQKGNAKRC
jgi:hypothetical protein